MTRIVTTAATLVCFISAAAFLSPTSLVPAAAQAGSCKNEAMSKDGKPLAGAARTSAIKKCCETAAVSKEGKPLAGAAKSSSVKKCVSEST
jgi:hypothetical protein